MSAIKIGIVDDHPIVRSGLRQFLGEQEGFVVVGEASNGKEAMDLVRHSRIDVLLMDLLMPERNGGDVLERLHANFPETSVLIFSGHPEASYGVQLLRQGARGYLHKTCEPDVLVSAIRRVASGRRYLSPALTQLMAEQLSPRQGRPAHELLSERELQVFVRLARGLKSGAIADQLSLSMKTVSSYRSIVMDKMGLTSNSDLTYYAMKHGLMD